MKRKELKLIQSKSINHSLVDKNGNWILSSFLLIINKAKKIQSVSCKILFFMALCISYKHLLSQWPNTTSYTSACTMMRSVIDKKRREQEGPHAFVSILIDVHKFFWLSRPQTLFKLCVYIQFAFKNVVRGGSANTILQIDTKSMI